MAILRELKCALNLEKWKYHRVDFIRFTNDVYSFYMYIYIILIAAINLLPLFDKFCNNTRVKTSSQSEKSRAKGKSIQLTRHTLWKKRQNKRHKIMVHLLSSDKQRLFKYFFVSKRTCTLSGLSWKYVIKQISGGVVGHHTFKKCFQLPPCIYWVNYLYGKYLHTRDPFPNKL